MKWDVFLGRHNQRILLNLTYYRTMIYSEKGKLEADFLFWLHENTLSKYYTKNGIMSH